MMMYLLIALLLVLLFLLVIPVTYAISLKSWELTLTIRYFFGWYKKEKRWNFLEDDEVGSDDIEIEEYAEDTAETVKETEHPSWANQLVYAYRVGVFREIGKAFGRLWAHSKPRDGAIAGTFGTGDPALTGMIGGWCHAFLSHITRDMIWIYTERKNDIHGMIKGRVVPFYLLWIMIRFIVSSSVWKFIQYRKGKYHGRRKEKTRI